MNGSNIEKCPKCGGVMEKGGCLTAYVTSVKLQSTNKEKQLLDDSVIPFYCKKCGYLELYRAMKEKTK